jgi:hypothetical protein
MKSTHFHDDHTFVVKHRAYSYSPSGGGFKASPLNYANMGATSLFTTVEDLAKWSENFHSAKVGGRAAIDQMLERGVLNNGTKLGYAMGLTVGKFKGMKTISHAGGDAGFRSHIVMFPERRLSVIVLSNAGNANAPKLATDTAEIYLADVMKPEAAASDPTRQFVKLAPEVMDPIVGKYRAVNGLIVQVKRDGDKLLASPPGQPAAELKPLSESKFWVEERKLEIEFEKQGAKAIRMFIRQGSTTIPGKRMDDAPPPQPDKLSEFAGLYYSPELGAAYEIVLRDGKLFAWHPKHGDIALTPISRNEFSASQFFLGYLAFSRDSQDRVNGFRMSGSRTQNVKFDRRD